MKSRTAIAVRLSLSKSLRLEMKGFVSQGEYEGESGEAPPAAVKANRFRGSGTIGGPSGAGDRIAATVSGSPLV